MRLLIIAVAWLTVGSLYTAQAYGQYSAPRARGSTAGRSRSVFNRPNLGYSPGGSLIANNLYNRPTVSPYLNLTRPQGLNTAPNYQTLVRPMAQQNRINRQQNQALRSLQAQTSARSAPASPDEDMRATGHTTQYMNLGGYFNSYGGQGAGS